MTACYQSYGPYRTMTLIGVLVWVTFVWISSRYPIPVCQELLSMRTFGVPVRKMGGSSKRVKVSDYKSSHTLYSASHHRKTI